MALLVLALLSLMLMILLLLGLVAVPGASRGRLREDGAVVELKLPSHRYFHLPGFSFRKPRYTRALVLGFYPSGNNFAASKAHSH